MAGLVFGEGTVLLRVVDLAVSLGGGTLLFALMFKVLPDVEVRWKDVWVEALVTAAGAAALALSLAYVSAGAALRPLRRMLRPTCRA